MVKVKKNVLHQTGSKNILDNVACITLFQFEGGTFHGNFKSLS